MYRVGSVWGGECMGWGVYEVRSVWGVCGVRSV